jgi:hypothetical protein
MNWYKIVLMWAVLFCESLGSPPARGQTELKESQVESLTGLSEFVRYLKPHEVSARDAQVVDRPEVAELFGRYRYAWRGTRWQFCEIISPLIHRYAIFWFFASEGLDDYSELTLLVNRESGQLHLIPIQNHSMVEYPKVEDDPHNIAIFNTLMGAEAMHPASATDWLQSALLYLNLIGERHQIADWEDLSGTGHAGMLTLLPKLKSLDLLPQVGCEAGKCDVRIFDLHPDQSHRIVWDLEFDSHVTPPQLNTVSRDLQPMKQARPSR